MSEATIRDLQTRRAIRQFQSAAPSAELLDLVLKTGTYAPTGQGKQAPVIIAVQDPQLRAQLTRMNAEYAKPGTDPYYGAPVIILVLADSTVGTWVEDGSCVLCTMMQAAHALGLTAVISSSIESSLGLTQLARIAAWLTPDTVPGLDTLNLMQAQLIRQWPGSTLQCLDVGALEPLR